MAFVPGPDRLARTKSSLRAFLRRYVELHPPFFRAFMWRCVEGFPGFVRERLPRFLRASGRRFIAWLPALAISLVCVEIVLQAAVRLGVANVDLPSYSIAYAKPFWQDINPHFGVWHPAHARYRHQRACFDLVYASNAHGMRDRDVELTSPSPRVVVVGDSFAEGWGAAYGRRFTEHLHQRTGIEHLNFGTSGDFGSTQSYLLYKTFAAQFDHRAVIFTILPENDFLDDTPTPWRLVRGARHRPYLVGTTPTMSCNIPPANGRATSVGAGTSRTCCASSGSRSGSSITACRWCSGSSRSKPRSTRSIRCIRTISTTRRRISIACATRSSRSRRSLATVRC